MPKEKPLYKLTVDLVTYFPDALNATLEKLQELTEEHDQVTGELKTKVIVETDSEEAVRQIRYQLETYLRQHKTQISGEVVIKEPLVRPEPTPLPMDAIEGFAERHGARTEFAVSSDREPR